MVTNNSCNYAPTQYNTLTGGANGTINNVSPGTSGQVLTSNGASAQPTFQAAAGGITTINGNSGSVTGSTVTLTGGTSGAVFTGSSATMTASFNFLNVPDSDSSANGTIKLNTVPFLHNFYSTNHTCLFLGPSVGNFTNTSSGTGSNAVCIGSTTMNAITHPNISNLVCIGGGALSGLTTGNVSGCVFIGKSAGSGITTGACTNSVAIGINACANNNGLTSSNNVIIGNAALTTSSDSSNTVAIGASALTATTSGDNNTAVGASSLASIDGGAYNAALGINSGSSLTGGDSSNIMIMAAGTAGDNNTIRLGTQGSGNGQQTKCFIAGIHGVTITGSAVLINTSGQLGDIASSIKFKENVQNLTEKESILNLRPVFFNYKEEKEKLRHFGFIAEEVEKVLPDLVIYKDDSPYSLKYHEMAPLLLLEIQRLKKEIEALKEKIK